MRWANDPSCGTVSVTASDLRVDADPARAIDVFSSGTRPDIPLRIQTSNEWLLVEFDHGLGDVHFMTEILAVIASGSAGYLEPAPLVNCDGPARAALMHALRTAPLPLLKSAKTLLSRSGGPTIDGPLSGPVYTRTATDFLDRVRDVRDRHCPGISIMSLLTFALSRAFRKHGTDVDNCVDMLVDLRRYLPSGKGTLSNFVGVVPVPNDRRDGALAFATALDQYTRGYGSLTRELASTLLSYRRPISPEFSQWRTTSSRARLVVTDMSARDEMNKLKYRLGHRRVCVIKVPQAYSHQICIAFVRLQSEVHITATLYDAYHDAEKIQLALDDFADEVKKILVLKP